MFFDVCDVKHVKNNKPNNPLEFPSVFTCFTTVYTHFQTFSMDIFTFQYFNMIFKVYFRFLLL